MSHAIVDQPVVEFGHVEHVPVHFDDLDAMGIVHNARYAVLLERALTPYWADRGVSFRGGGKIAPDLFHAVREFAITFRAPITGTGPVAVHFWLEHFGTSSAEYGFRFRSVDGSVVHAEGRRAIVRLDPATLRPAPWTDAARAVAATLLRPAPVPA
ncbi:acyl-CoA thioesterase [Micromonospora phytophila]|uniref:acyl-CoA thioesterase n=1 Tax=Micromonospora phytophila TaxID=709888 RepID=UPI00202FB6C6|nr:thioesterase family protein [Micromonospora phytophila]MCM0677531.1 acyl-CoA thioesterase [Micromonospora phytophila]